MARHTSDRDDTGDRSGPSVRRRPLLQAVGAAGVVGAAVGASSGETEAATPGEGDPGNGPSDVLPTSSQFYSFNSLTGPSLDDAFVMCSSDAPEATDGDPIEGHSNADLIRISDRVGLDSYEPAGLDDEEAMLAAQEETGCYMSSAHVSTGDVEDDPEGTAETYAQFAHDGRNPPLVEPIISSGWDSEEGVIENARRINEAADLMAEQGFKFGYHNHDHEFQYLDEEAGLRAYDVFMEHLDEKVYVQLDVAWVYAGVDRPDPIHYITEYGDKIESLHMKNWTEDGEELTEIHKGDLDQAAIAEAAIEHSNVDHLVYEYDGTPHPFHSFEYASLVLNNINGSGEMPPYGN